MTRRPCTRCGRPVLDAGQICHACVADLKRALATISDLWGALQEAITKQTVMGARTDHKPTKASEQPLPLNLHASAIGTRARTVLVGWARVLVEDSSLEAPADTVPAIIDWLHGHVHVLRRHEAAVEACDEITWLSGDITRAVDIPRDKAVHPAGPCPEIVDESPCDGIVHAHVPVDSDKIWFDCKKCGATWDSTQLNRLGDRISARKAQIARQRAWGAKPAKPEPKPEPKLAGLTVTANQYGIPLGTMRRWLANGVLIRYGDGKPWLVDTQEVARLRATRRIAE